MVNVYVITTQGSSLTTKNNNDQFYKLLRENKDIVLLNDPINNKEIDDPSFGLIDLADIVLINVSAAGMTEGESLIFDPDVMFEFGYSIAKHPNENIIITYYEDSFTEKHLFGFKSNLPLIDYAVNIHPFTCNGYHAMNDCYCNPFYDKCDRHYEEKDCPHQHIKDVYDIINDKVQEMKNNMNKKILEMNKVIYVDI